MAQVVHRRTKSKATVETGRKNKKMAGVHTGNFERQTKIRCVGEQTSPRWLAQSDTQRWDEGGGSSSGSLLDPPFPISGPDSAARLRQKKGKARGNAVRRRKPQQGRRKGPGLDPGQIPSRVAEQR